MKLTTVIIAAIVLTAAAAAALEIRRLNHVNDSLSATLKYRTSQVEVENATLRNRNAELERIIERIVERRHAPDDGGSAAR